MSAGVEGDECWGWCFSKFVWIFKKSKRTTQKKNDVTIMSWMKHTTYISNVWHTLKAMTHAHQTQNQICNQKQIHTQQERKRDSYEGLLPIKINSPSIRAKRDCNPLFDIISNRLLFWS